MSHADSTHAARLTKVQKNFPDLDDPGTWGQPWRLVVEQKEVKVVMVQACDTDSDACGWVGLDIDVSSFERPNDP